MYLSVQFYVRSMYKYSIQLTAGSFTPTMKIQFITPSSSWFISALYTYQTIIIITSFSLFLCSYFAVVVYKVLVLMIEELGGSNAFLQRFSGKTFRINTGPCCCCCLCLPRVPMSRYLYLFIHSGYSVLVQITQVCVLCCS